MSDYLWAKLWWLILLGAAAFIAGLMGWLPHQRKKRDEEQPPQ
jgi:hypothetical protein